MPGLRRGTICSLIGPACLSLAGSAFAGGGDDPFTAETITALPFTAAGDTADNTDQFDVICPFSGSTSPDAWYTYTTVAKQGLVIDVCDSAYDTKLYVLDANFNEIACVDDSCSDRNGNPFRSNLEILPLLSGTTVFIVVDGFGGDSGPYTLTVTGTSGPPECIVPCPAGFIPEGEDDDGQCDQTIDTNGGCGSDPFIITDVACGDTICGIAWADGGSRDTDWYRLGPHAAPTLVTVTAAGEFDGAFFYLGENPECSSVKVLIATLPGPCETAELSAIVTGETWWFAAPNGFDGLPCGVGGVLGNDYVIDFACTPTPCPTLGDANGDGAVDFDDLLLVLANFGPCP
jgi:hypothetical protein